MIDNYNALSIGQMMEIDAILRDEDAEDLDKQVRIIAVLSGMTEAQLLALPLPEFSALAAQTAFLRKPLESFPEKKDRYTVGEFTLIPASDPSKILTAQYIDFQERVKESVTDIPAILSIFLVPEGKTYVEGYDVAAVKQAISKEMPMADAFGLAGFFFKSLADLIVASLTSCKQDALRMKDKEKAGKILRNLATVEKLFVSGGDGLPM